MDVLRRNTDYALLAMVYLAAHWKQSPASVRKLASQEHISYSLLRKLMQKLCNSGFVESSMGSKGGFSLSRQPSEINVLEIIETIQGPLRLNRCLLGLDICSRRKGCLIGPKLVKLQNYMKDYLHGITLEDLSPEREASKEKETN